MKLLINYCKLSLLIALFVAESNIKAQTIPAEMPVSYDVSASGAFQYTVPLRIPPGIKDMVPNLAINYNSQSGNGMLGVGWSLSGLSVITRGMPTIFHDQMIAPVDFNVDDVLFLDGQRLFGNGASTYLTEVKNFATIQGHGTAGSSHAYFTVEYPNGTVYEYGNTTDSRMLAQGKSDPLYWAVNKITDVHGNYLTFTYYNNSSTGEYRITGITYGLNDNTMDDIPVTIEFDYTTRQDENTAWVAGSAIAMNKLLDFITIRFSNSDQANKYTFSYDHSGLHPKLIEINELRAGSDKPAPIKITWSSPPPQLITTQALPIPRGAYDCVAGDFDGDGFVDIITKNGTDCYLYLNDGLGTFTLKTGANIPPIFNSGPITAWGPRGSHSVGGISRIKPSMYFDYNGDGFDDIIVIQMYNKGGAIQLPSMQPTFVGTPYYEVWLYKANGDPTTVFEPGVRIYNKYSDGAHNKNDNFNSLTHFQAGDFDGDGKSELIIAHPYHFDNLNSVADYEFFLIGEEYGAHKIHHIADHINGTMVVDYNGDGRDEFIFTQSSVSYIFGLNHNFNSNFEPQLQQTATQWPVTPDPLISSEMPHTFAKNWFGDFNGDGKDDLLCWNTNTSQWTLVYSTGNISTYHPSNSLVSTSGSINWPLPNLSSTGPSGNDHSLHTGDFNGDGLVDILQLEYSQVTQNTTYHMYFSKGTLNFSLETGVYPGYAGYDDNHVGDYNGDGQTDILSSKGWEIISFHENDNSRLVGEIDHAGKILDITYKSIARDQDYASYVSPNNHYLSKTFPVKVTKTVSDNFMVNNTYYYEGLLYHKYGLGIRGFKKFTVENVANQKIYQTFELGTTIPYLKEQVVFDPLGNFGYGSYTTYQQLDFPGGANGKSRIIINSPLKVTDNIAGSAVITDITTGSTSPGTVFYDFGKIESLSLRTKDLAGGLNSLETTTYDYGSNWAMLKGKPESITVYNDIDPTGANSITRTTEYSYYSNGEIQTVITDPGTVNEKVENIQYNYPYGQVSQTDLTANGVVGTVSNQYTYSIDGKFLIEEENTLGYTTTHDYGNLAHTWGNVLSTTDHKGLVTEYTYDAVNRIITEKDQLSGIEVFTDYKWAAASPYAGSLTNAHLVVSKTNSYDITHSTSVFDEYGNTLRDVSTSLNGDIYKDYTYNNIGQIKTIEGPYETTGSTPHVTTTFTYDDYNRETERSTDNNGPVIQTSYSEINGLLHTTVTNLGAGTWKTSVTCGNTLRKIINSGTPNHTIDYTYYGNGATATTVVNSGSGNSKTFTNIVDNYGRTTSRTQPNAGTISYDYDALDQVIIETRATGTVFEYTYDLLGRVVEKHEQGKPSSYKYTYDYEDANGMSSTGELIQETSPNGHIKDYTFTAEGWLQSVEEDNFFETIYSYFPNGDLQYYTFNNDITIEYTYYYSGLIQNVFLVNGGQFPSNQQLWHGWALNQYGQREGGYFYDATNSPGYADRRTYDLLGQLERREIMNLNQGATLIVDNQYLFNPHTDNLAWRRDNLPSRNNTEYFTYENHYDQLKTVLQSIGGGAATQTLGMGYDINGNITQKDDVAPVDPMYPNWKYDEYALATVQVPGAPPFPPNVAIPEFRQDVTYTSFEKVESIREDQNNEVLFTYGTADARVSATYNDITGPTPNLYKVKHYYNNYERIDYPTGSKDELFYVWAGEELVSVLKVFTQPGQPPVSNIYYPVRDYLGSITHLLSTNGNAGTSGNGIVEERSFDAWGRTRDPNNWQHYPVGGHPGFWITDRGYTGHEHIWQPTFASFYDNNIINMNGRIYDPLVGRMFSPDPVIPNTTNSQDYNKYTYARNNPLKYTDPDGTTPVHAAAILIGAGIGGAINVATHWDDIYNGKDIDWGKFGTAFGIGAVAGAITVATAGAAMPSAAGMTATSYAAAGALTGGLGAGSGAIVRSYGNHAAFGDPLMTDDQFLMEVAGGAVFNGLSNYMIARIKGMPVRPPRETPLKPMPTRSLQQINTPYQKGQEGLRLNNITQNTQRIPSYSKTARYRVPDEMIKYEGKIRKIGEVKHYSVGRVVNYTNQLKDFINYSNTNQIPFQLYIPNGVRVSAPLQGAIDNSFNTTIIRY